MELKLTKPLCFFDLETTGVRVATDRIVEISILKVWPNGKEEILTRRVNPEMPIPAESSAVHGIYDKDVASEPTFNQIAGEIYNFMKDSDWAGYNLHKFDVPVLAEELLRAGIDFNPEKHRIVDVQNIFHKMEQRTLSAAVQFYCNKELEGAHGAEADTVATYEVMKAQLGRYNNLENNVAFLEQFSQPKNRFADYAGFIHFNDRNEEIFGFGKYKGQLVKDVFAKDPGYFSWLQQADFPAYTKKIFTSIRLKDSKLGS